MVWDSVSGLTGVVQAETGGDGGSLLLNADVSYLL